MKELKNIFFSMLQNNIINNRWNKKLINKNNKFIKDAFEQGVVSEDDFHLYKIIYFFIIFPILIYNIFEAEPKEKPIIILEAPNFILP